MKKIMAIALVAVMVIALCACGSDFSAGGQGSGKKVDAGAMVLIEKGTVPDGVDFTSGGILTKSEGEKVQILNQNGASFNDKWYDDVNSLISNGICVVSNTDANGKELLGIVDSISEKELVPCEAVEVVMLSDRFILLGYETGVGTDDDKFGFYYTDSETVNYKGYGKILDLDNGRVVPGVEIKTSKYDVSAAGNMIFVEKEHPATDVYNAEGKLVGTHAYIYAYPESGIALQSTTEGVCVYDKDLKLISTLPTTDMNEKYEPVEGTDEMLVHEYVKNDTRYYCVTDLSGKSLTAEYTRILQVYPDGFLSITEGDDGHIVDFAGNDIVSGFDTVRYAEPGYFVTQVQNEGYYVYDKTGKKITETAMADGYSGLIVKDDAGKVLVLETGEMLAAEGFAREQTGNLVLIESTLYDVITGKTVLTDVDACVATGGSLYVWDNEKETYTRYLAEFKSAG